MTITSQHNQHLKEIRKLRMRRRERERAGRFVAEGEDLLASADAAGWAPVERYCAAGSGLAGVEVEPELLARASGLASGTRALAVYEERWSAGASGPICVYLHGVHDPGNVGTILRAAEAFGAGSVALGPGCADPFGPKAVRASMGALFAVPLARIEGEGGPSLVGQLPGRRIALAAGAEVSLGDALHPHGPSPSGEAEPEEAVGEITSLQGDITSLQGEITLMIGAEREGLPADLLSAADLVARIPIRTHSLNAAMAASVALYEATRRMAHP